MFKNYDIIVNCLHPSYCYDIAINNMTCRNYYTSVFRVIKILLLLSRRRPSSKHCCCRCFSINDFVFITVIRRGGVVQSSVSRWFIVIYYNIAYHTVGHRCVFIDELVRRLPRPWYNNITSSWPTIQTFAV